MTPRKPTIVADDKIPFLRGVFESCGCSVRYLPGAKIAPGDVRDADALITRTRTRCDEALLADSRIRFIATATIGYDHIDTDYLARRKIAWTNAPGCNAGSVMQYLVSVLTSLAERHDFRLAGKTLGVVGVGNVGRKVAAAGEALGMRVLLNDPPRAEREKSGAFLPLAELLRESDFLTFHTPLERGGANPTWHLADASMLGAMKPDAWLINTSRGEVCDNAALKRALQERRIGGAVLDVWESEPEFDRELHSLLAFGTPHIAGYSTDGKANGTMMSVRAVAEFFGMTSLTGFEPAGLPEPETAELDLDRIGMGAAIRASYDVAQDDAALRNAPERFEELRGNYRIRREFRAFSVFGGKAAGRESLLALGFRRS